MSKGFLWTVELTMGLILLSSMWTSGMENAPSMSRMDETLCMDLAVLYTYGASVQEFVQLYYSEWDIEWQSTPFENEKGITCHAERVENGTIKPIFIRIR